jgi:hypothetical protein
VGAGKKLRGRKYDFFRGADLLVKNKEKMRIVKLKEQSPGSDGFVTHGKTFRQLDR